MHWEVTRDLVLALGIPEVNFRKRRASLNGQQEPVTISQELGWGGSGRWQQCGYLELSGQLVGSSLRRGCTCPAAPGAVDFRQVVARAGALGEPLTAGGPCEE